MEPTSLIDDAEFWLPPEFLTDEDFLVSKENEGGGIDESNKCLFPYAQRHGFGCFGFNSTVKSRVFSSETVSDEENFLAGLTRQMFQSTLEDDLSGGLCGNYLFLAGNDNRAWAMSRSPQSTLCGAGTGCFCRNHRSNQNCQLRFSSQAAWDLYCAATEEVAMMNIANEAYDCNNHNGRGLLDFPSNHYFTAAKNLNNLGYYKHESLPHQKLQAIRMKQQQLLKHHRRLVQQSRGVRVNSNKNGGPVDMSSSAWSHQPPPRDNSGMRTVFLGNHAGKRASTGTGVFIPRRVNHTSPATAEACKPILVPARVTQVLNLNLNESAVQPGVRSSVNLNADASRRQRSNNGEYWSQLHNGVKAEQPVNEPRLPSDWAY